MRRWRFPAQRGLLRLLHTSVQCLVGSRMGEGLCWRHPDALLSELTGMLVVGPVLRLISESTGLAPGVCLRSEMLNRLEDMLAGPGSVSATFSSQLEIVECAEILTNIRRETVLVCLQKYHPSSIAELKKRLNEEGLLLSTFLSLVISIAIGAALGAGYFFTGVSSALASTGYVIVATIFASHRRYSALRASAAREH